jgi:hypothetical protein
MDTSEVLALTGVFGAIVIVVIQQMYPTIHKYIGWPVVGVLLIISIFLISPDNISVGWEITIIVAIIAIMGWLTIYYWCKRTKNNQITSNTNNSSVIKPTPNKDKGIQIHNEIIVLLNKLSDTCDKLSKNEKPLENTEVKKILDEIQIKINDLGHLINKREYDRYSESWITMITREVEHHSRKHEYLDMWGGARVNSNIRYFVSKIKE